METLNLNRFHQRFNFRCQALSLVLATTLAILFGCSHTEKVQVPPKVQLKDYHNIGVIEFSTNAEETLRPYVTQNFIQNVQSAQPGTRILELGSEEHILKLIKRHELDSETIQSIGKKYNVDALILGHLEISEIKPKVKIFAMPQSVHAQAYVEASLRTKLLETDSGVTLWTHASAGKTAVANVHLINEGPFTFGVSDPKEKYGKLVPELVFMNTMDFRSRYEYQKVR